MKVNDVVKWKSPSMPGQWHYGIIVDMQSDHFGTVKVEYTHSLPASAQSGRVITVTAMRLTVVRPGR